jgi:hypothetical protein
MPLKIIVLTFFVFDEVSGVTIDSEVDFRDRLFGNKFLTEVDICHA